MGVLAPLYLAGLAALSLPLILHLVRRTPRGRQDFSSLMFLTPSPPRLTRRSRLDQLLLLVLRLAALGLLAFAFARPFLREAATLALDDLPARRVALLVDTSASMRRGDLWQQALKQLEKELSDLGPHDEMALYSFGDSLQTVVGFDAGEADTSASKIDIVRSAAKKLQPTWQATDLGTALAAVAGELAAASDVKQLAAEPQIIVISDCSKGSRLDALQAFEWPKGVHVIPRPLKPKHTTNAFAQLLTSNEEASAGELRVRVASAADSTDDQFFVAWASGDRPTDKASETAVYVPPGQSRVIKLPRPEDNLVADRIVLRGDGHEFDNTYYVVPPRKQQIKLVYFGNDAADDEHGPQYYLRLATRGDWLRQVEVEQVDKDDGAVLAVEPRPHLVIVTRKVAADLAPKLKAFAERGGTVVLAPSDEDAAKILPAVLDDVELAAKPREAGEFLLFGEIDFGHPLFVPFANPRYSDFTKIHFWKHRPLGLKDGAATKAIARFDSGEPAILERRLDKGRVIVLASGWQPEDSQLALSTKFVPFIAALLDQACGSAEPLASITVGQSIPLAANGETRTVIRKPDGSEVRASSTESPLTAHHSPASVATDQPGIYTIGSGATEDRFAVNLAPNESNTAPLEMEQLDQFGVKTGAVLTRSERLGRIRQERDTELESRQKIWRWLLIAALGILVVETILAGRATRHIAQAESLA
jgi:hypothetical protein